MRMLQYDLRTVMPLVHILRRIFEDAATNGRFQGSLLVCSEAAGIIDDPSCMLRLLLSLPGSVAHSARKPQSYFTHSTSNPATGKQWSISILVCLATSPFLLQTACRS